MAEKEAARPATINKIYQRYTGILIMGMPFYAKKGILLWQL
jgi:hypothetical protein